MVTMVVRAATAVHADMVHTGAEVDTAHPAVGVDMAVVIPPAGHPHPVVVEEAVAEVVRAILQAAAAEADTRDSASRVHHVALAFYRHYFS